MAHNRNLIYIVYINITDPKKHTLYTYTTSYHFKIRIINKSTKSGPTIQYINGPPSQPYNAPENAHYP